MGDQPSDLSTTVRKDSNLLLRQQYKQSLDDLEAVIVQLKGNAKGFLDVGQDVLKLLSDSRVDTLSENEAFQRVTDAVLEKVNMSSGALSSTLAAVLCKIAPLLNIALGISGFAAEASGFAPLGLVATGLGAVLGFALEGIERSEVVAARLNKLPRIRDQVQEVIDANQHEDEGIVAATFELMIALNVYLGDSLVHLSKSRVRRALSGLKISSIDESGSKLDDARKAFEQVLQHKVNVILLVWRGTAIRSELLDWYKVIDFAEVRSNYLQQACEGTGIGFLNASEITRFREGSLRWLWCEGRAGVGKSTLVARLLHEIEHPTLTNPAQNQIHVLTYAFCSVNDQQRQDTENILRSLLGQVIEAQYERVQHSARDFRRKHSYSQPTIGDYVECLAQNIPWTHSLIIVIDALDELSHWLKAELVDALRNLSKLLHDRLRVLVMTRPLDELRSRVGLTDEVLKIESSNSDLEIFLNARLRKKAPLRNLDLKMLSNVVDTIVKKADKTFMLGKLQLASLYDPPIESIGELEDRLDHLTLRLDEFYDKSLKIIGSSEGVLRLLRWLLVLPRRLEGADYEAWEKKHPTQRQGPLSSQELRHALAIKHGKTSSLSKLQRYMIPLEQLVESSGGLCSFSQSGLVVSFTHPTVQEYLMQWPKLGLSEIPTYKCHACIQYLSMDDFKSGACKEMVEWQTRLEDFPFLEYAARNWCIIRGMTDDWEAVNLALEPAIIKLLSDPGLASSLQQVIGYSHGRMRNKKIYIPKTTGLIIAMQFNLLNVLEKMLQSGADIHAQAESGQTALDLAVTASPEFVELLLRYNARVRDQSGRNALRLALFDFPSRRMRGGAEIIKMLVEADPLAIPKGGKEEIEGCFDQIEWLRNQTMMEAERKTENQAQMEYILELFGLDKNGPKPPWWKVKTGITSSHDLFTQADVGMLYPQAQWLLPGSQEGGEYSWNPSFSNS